MFAIKRELKLNNKERTLLAQHAGFSRLVYNFGLSLMNQLDHTEFKGSSSKKIAAIKKVFTNFTKQQIDNTWINSLSSKVYQSAFDDLKNAYTRWFKGLSERPQFKRKRDKNSFTVYDGNGLTLVKLKARSKKQRKVIGTQPFAKIKKIKIPTLGTFKLYEALEANFVSQTFTLSKEGSKWYVSFSVNAEKIPPLFHEKGKVGIDLGVKCFATLSDATSYEAPKPMKKAKTKLAKLQWRNRNKQLGNHRQGIRKSNNAAKYYGKLANRHAHIANQRKDFLHKTTTEISRKYARIRIEDLNVKGMVANHKLSSAISDLGFYEFRRQLVYKQSHYGTKVELVDRWYPSSKICSNCGHIQPMPLVERVFKCECCKSEIDRDLNASINLENAP